VNEETGGEYLASILHFPLIRRQAGSQVVHINFLNEIEKIYQVKIQHWSWKREATEVLCPRMPQTSHASWASATD
jgi:hypothetical protein